MAVHSPNIVRMDDPFRLTGCSTAVNNIKDVIIINFDIRGIEHVGRRLQLLIVTVARGVGTVCQDKITGRNGVKIISDLLQRLNHAGIGKHHDHIGIIQQRF